MSNLEDIIKNNAESFNRSEPSENHFAKMQEKIDALNAKNTKRKSFNINTFLRYASVFILLITSAYFAVTISNAKAGCNIANYQETQNYYNVMINNHLAELQTSNIEASELELIRREISEIENQFNSAEDICENPDNEQVINSIVQNYKLKVKVINKITK